MSQFCNVFLATVSNGNQDMTSRQGARSAAAEVDEAIMANPTRSFSDLHTFLKQHLLESVIPFWLEHAVDPAGGLNSCIRDDGTVDNREKWLWSQWRAVWVYSSLYNLIEPRPEWLDVARHICSFAGRHGWDDEVGGWVLCLSGEGEVVRGCESIYVDGFAIYGLVALARATGDEQFTLLARKTADHALRRLAAPHDEIPQFPFPAPKGARVNGIGMIFSLVFWELGQFADDDKYRAAAIALCDDMFTNFYRRDRNMWLERIAADNNEFPPPLGTAVVPGHVIEAMWFQIHIARDQGNRERIDECVRLIKRHLELGWDEEYGGILLAIDADGADDVGWEFADTKLWWPQTEALYALLLAYEHSGEDWCLEWYDKVHAYSFANYPVAEHGEWRQKLSRDGKPITDVVVLPVKDPFHLPRALIYCVDVLSRLAGRNSPNNSTNATPNS